MLDWHILCKSNIPDLPGVVARVGSKPNAQLIAAAPELLKACKEALKDLEYLKHYISRCHNATKDLQQAIAKAEGAI